MESSDPADRICVVCGRNPTSLDARGLIVDEWTWFRDEWGVGWVCPKHEG